MDTDSLIWEYPGKIPEHLIHQSELGKMKIEYKIKKGILIASKMYFLEVEDS
jgi:hypothetical protein